MSESMLDPGAAARLKRLGGERLLREMILLFLQHGPERIDAAEQGSAGGDLARVEHACHSLKSSAGNLGATALQQAAAATEHAAEAGDAAAVAAALPLLAGLYQASELELRNLMAGLEP